MFDSECMNTFFTVSFCLYISRLSSASGMGPESGIENPIAFVPACTELCLSLYEKALMKVYFHLFAHISAPRRDSTNHLQIPFIIFCAETIPCLAAIALRSFTKVQKISHLSLSHLQTPYNYLSSNRKKFQKLREYIFIYANGQSHDV